MTETLKNIVCGLGALYLIYHCGSLMLLLAKELLHCGFKRSGSDLNSESGETQMVRHTSALSKDK